MIIKPIKKLLHNVSRVGAILVEIRDSLAKQTEIMREIREGVANQSSLINDKLIELIHGSKNQTEVINRKLNRQNDLLSASMNQNSASFQTVQKGVDSAAQSNVHSFEEAMQKHPLLFDYKTYNTSHPDYDATVVRNFPGKIFNLDASPASPVYNELKKMIQNGEIPEVRWKDILKETLEEAKTVPHADEVFQRKAFVENYMEELETKYHAYYKPGWVNLDDALFLYWVVRQLKPKVIVQTGVCNGLSSAFMMLALAKNGPEGTLHVVDMPPVFDSKDDNWKIRDKVYGVVIPEGKTSGWIVPDAYRDRFEVLNGDAKLLLPGLLKKVGKVDMFYHDSDHTYNHMMFEFQEAKKYLTKEGVIVSDDISWNASLWDFADEYKVPAYNYRGSMGVACF
jgi:predicted O-methyltransferase YrrM